MSLPEKTPEQEGLADAAYWALVDCLDAMPGTLPVTVARVMAGMNVEASSYATIASEHVSRVALAGLRPHLSGPVAATAADPDLTSDSDVDAEPDEDGEPLLGWPNNVGMGAVTLSTGHRFQGSTEDGEPERELVRRRRR